MSAFNTKLTQLYFPNINFVLVRSHHPPHQAVFKCPKSLNKIDIKNYLEALYKVHVTDVRTLVYLGRLGQKDPFGKRERHASYKKAIVTMTEDFIFPPESTAATKLPTAPKRGRTGKNNAADNKKEEKNKAAGSENTVASGNTSKTIKDLKDSKDSEEKKV
ncbi:hypothetical protein HK099_008291 [Clydaea vesicula]|uniref:Large ribosomal subunit protein uL23m n=1 Tax=Clydaea vesicula TaxID=447962 RepID=A0AAD5XZ62_9FUNG|nr:hypothetical protein HK099_008291 [Clydaea vesicula]KAJ3397167.1 hypothetical protein HDU92_000472 [Lobulomyces angularis]